MGSGVFLSVFMPRQCHTPVPPASEKERKFHSSRADNSAQRMDENGMREGRKRQTGQKGTKDVGGMWEEGSHTEVSGGTLRTGMSWKVFEETTWTTQNTFLQGALPESARHAMGVCEGGRMRYVTWMADPPTHGRNGCFRWRGATRLSMSVSLPDGRCGWFWSRSRLTLEPIPPQDCPPRTKSTSL